MDNNLLALPSSQLESLRFKAQQIIDSLESLLRTVEANNANYLPPWPEILSKYNILLSQTHSFAASLTTPQPRHQSALVQAPPRNPVADTSLVPNSVLPTDKFNNDVLPYLRVHQTFTVIDEENATVKRLSEHMNTKGALTLQAYKSASFDPTQVTAQNQADHDAVLAEINQIRMEHDSRAERAQRAIEMLKEKYEWHARVAVEVEEPEEFEWDASPKADDVDMEEIEASEGDGDEDDDDDDDDDDDEADEDLVNASLNPNQYPPSTPTAINLDL